MTRTEIIKQAIEELRNALNGYELTGLLTITYSDGEIRGGAWYGVDSYDEQLEPAEFARELAEAGWVAQHLEGVLDEMELAGCEEYELRTGDDGIEIVGWTPTGGLTHEITIQAAE